MIQLSTTLQADQRVWSIDWHPTMNLLVSVGSSKKIQFWKQINEKWIKTESLQTDHLKTIRCIKFSNKGDKIAACSFDSLVSIYILNEGNFQFLAQLQGHQSEVKCIDWHLTDKKIVSCSRDKNIWIWGFNETTFQYECENILQGHTQDVKCVIWLDYNTIASASYDNTIKIWSQNDDDFQCTQTLVQHSSIVWSLTFKNNMLASCSSDGSIILWRLDQQSKKFELDKKINNIHLEPIYACQFVDSYIISGGGDNALKIINYSSADNEILQTQYHQNDINCIRSIQKQNYSLIASCSDDHKIKIFKFKPK